MSLPTQDVRPPALPYQGLLEVSESITRHGDLVELLHDMGRRLRPVVPFDFISLMLHDDDDDVMRLHVLESERPHQVYHAPDAVPAESPGVVVWRTQQPMLIADFEQETRFPDMTPVWRGFGMRSGYYLPLTTAQRRLGTIHFASAAPVATMPPTWSCSGRWRAWRRWPWTTPSISRKRGAFSGNWPASATGCVCCWRSTTPSSPTSTCASCS